MPRKYNNCFRSKEDAHDYRYFTEPDIPPVVISQKTIDEIKATIPTLPTKIHFLHSKAKLSNTIKNSFKWEIILNLTK